MSSSIFYPNGKTKILPGQIRRNNINSRKIALAENKTLRKGEKGITRGSYPLTRRVACICYR